MNKTRYKKLLQKIFKNFFYLLFKLKHGKIKFDKIIQKNLFEEENVIIEKTIIDTPILYILVQIQDFIQIEYKTQQL